MILINIKNMAPFITLCWVSQLCYCFHRLYTTIKSNDKGDSLASETPKSEQVNKRTREEGALLSKQLEQVSKMTFEALQMVFKGPLGSWEGHQPQRPLPRT